jgi:hypothetical protein
MGRSTDPIDPMMRATCAPAAVRLFVVSCWNCHHEAVLDAKRWSGATACGLGPIRAYFGVASYFSSASSRRHDENAAENGTLNPERRIRRITDDAPRKSQAVLFLKAANFNPFGRSSCRRRS